MKRVQDIHGRNVLMLKLLLGFYFISLLVNLVVDKRIYVLNPPIGLLLGVLLLFLVISKRIPEITMYLMIVSLYVFMLAITLSSPFLVNFIFLGLFPLVTLLYLDYRAVILSGAMYLITAMYMFNTLHKVIFPGVDSDDLVYIVVFGLFTTAFSLFFTRFTKNLWRMAEQSEHRLSSILENVEIATWTYHFSEGRMKLSEGIASISGLPAEALEGDYHSLLAIVLPEDRPLIVHAQKEMVLDRRSIKTECRVIRNDGEYRWAQIRGTPYFNKLGHLERLEGVIIDITERKRLEEQVEYLAYHDELTSLPNRALFNMRFEEYIDEGSTQLTIMFIDLDNFKEVNDAFGHSAGDLLLQETAARLSGQIRDTDMVCRLGGDEFLLLLCNSDVQHATKVAERIIASLSKPFYYQGYPLIATPSIGICVYQGGPCELDSLIREADEAMYEAKREGRNQYFIHPASIGITY